MPAMARGNPLPLMEKALDQAKEPGGLLLGSLTLLLALAPQSLRGPPKLGGPPLRLPLRRSSTTRNRRTPGMTKSGERRALATLMRGANLCHHWLLCLWWQAVQSRLYAFSAS